MNNSIEEIINQLSNKIIFAKINQNAITPTKDLENAGYDFYPCFEAEGMVIHPNETVKIPTGIATAFSNEYALILKERSSTGTKGIGQRSGVVDSGYRGEILAPITNHTNKTIIIAKDSLIEKIENLGIDLDITIHPYTKAICQGVLVVIPNLEPEEISYEDLKKIPSKRGTGKEGSTGK